MPKSDWIYLDNAATTSCSEIAVKAATEAMREDYFNPSAAYHPSIVLKERIVEARREILSLLHGDGRIVFTAGGTESDNLALFGTKKHNCSRIIVSNAEHAAVYRSALELKQRGYDVVFAPVDERGCIIEDDFLSLLTTETALVSVMHVNNETGGINDVARLANLVKSRCPNAIFHSDGVQAMGKISVNLAKTAIDLYSVSAHKLHAPKGVGALFVRKGVGIKPIVFGGGQEDGLRSSTENVPAILAFGAMASYYRTELSNASAKVKRLNLLVRAGLGSVEGVRILSAESDSPYILAILSSRVRGEVMQHALEREGILIGTGSACSNNRAGKRIPEALGLKGGEERGMVRVSFSDENTEEEIEKFTEAFLRNHRELEKYGN